MTSVAYRVSGLHHSVGGARILDGVDIEVRYGRVLALVGPNGAGKSTLLGALAGDLRPTSGVLRLDDRDLAGWAPQELARTRAVLLQENQVTFAFSARQVVQMGRAPWSGDGHDGQDDEIVQAALRRTDALHLADRPFAALSGGEKARVSLARVLAQQTRVILLDEPTAALDLRHQEEVMHIAVARAREGAAVVAVLHDLSLAAAYADEVAILAEGRLVERGDPGDVLTAEVVGEVYGTPVRVTRDPDTGRPLVLPRRG